MDLASIFIVLLITLIALFMASYALAAANIKEIKTNWVKYRCNPLYMPLANLVGSDIITNFMGCTMSTFQVYAGFALDPIYEMFGILNKSIGSISGSLNEFRTMITGTKGAFIGIIDGVYNKLQNSLSTTVQLINRIRTLTSRILAVFVTIFHMVSTGVQTGTSVANGPVGQAAEFFCFSPSTAVNMNDGSKTPINRIIPGDILQGNITVESILILDGSSVPMYYLDGTSVSGNHKVLYNGKWIRVEKHPDALLLPGIEYEKLYCLNTSNNTIPIGKYIYKDYEETSDPAILSKFESIVEMSFNNTVLPENKNKRKNPLEYRRSGTTPFVNVVLENGKLKKMKDLKIGDTLAKGGAVLGMVYHKSNSDPIWMDNRVPVEKGTWILSDKLYSAEAVGQVSYEFKDEIHCCMNLLTEGGLFIVENDGKRFIMLDDQEITESWVHRWRDNEVQKDRN